MLGLDKLNPMEEIFLRVPSNQSHFFANVAVMVHGVSELFNLIFFLVHFFTLYAYSLDP